MVSEWESCVVLQKREVTEDLFNQIALIQVLEDVPPRKLFELRKVILPDNLSTKN